MVNPALVNAAKARLKLLRNKLKEALRLVNEEMQSQDMEGERMFAIRRYTNEINQCFHEYNAYRNAVIITEREENG